MNKRLWFKIVFVLVVLLFMVLMGMSNKEKAQFSLFGKELFTATSALMYFLFFSVGVVAGAVVAVGPSRAFKSKNVKP